MKNVKRELTFKEICNMNGIKFDKEYVDQTVNEFIELHNKMIVLQKLGYLKKYLNEEQKPKVLN